MHEVKWSIKGGRTISLPPFLVAGIINVTPDSFSDGGLYFKHGMAVEHALGLLNGGARILDFGGESTRPGSRPVGEAEEIRRVVPVIREVSGLRSKALELDPQSLDAHPAAFAAVDAPLNDNSVFSVKSGAALLSVDTWRAGTAAAAAAAGADIVNDISGAVFDPAMPEFLASCRPGYILCHCPALPENMQAAPRYHDVLEEVYSFFAERLEALEKAGLPAEYVALDPGIGFGKNLKHNLDLLRGLDRLHSLGRPLCIGLSRKTLIGDLLGLSKGAARDGATQVLTALAAARGAQIHRVHDAAGAVRALRIAKALDF